MYSGNLCTSTPNAAIDIPWGQTPRHGFGARVSRYWPSSMNDMVVVGRRLTMNISIDIIGVSEWDADDDDLCWIFIFCLQSYFNDRWVF